MSNFEKEDLRFLTPECNEDVTSDFEGKIMEYFNDGYCIKCECKKDVLRVLNVFIRNDLCWRTGNLISEIDLEHALRILDENEYISYMHKKIGSYSWHDKSVEGKESVLCWDHKKYSKVITVFEIDRCLLNRQ